MLMPISEVARKTPKFRSLLRPEPDRPPDAAGSALGKSGMDRVRCSGFVSPSVKSVTRGIAVAMVGALSVVPIAAQEPGPIARSATPIATAIAAPPDPADADSSTAKRFIRDVGGDYKNFFSLDTALWLGVGGGAALAVHPADQRISDAARDANNSWPGGSVYGSQYLQVPLAIGWWAIASAAGSERHAETGRDLLRAQIAVFSWTYAIKLATDRTRPNGDSHSFPSGHASTSFATAMVLQDHYGWKVGLPAFLVASYTAASRVALNQHWTSDVVFGAALGMASARTVTIKFRESRLVVSPVVAGRRGAVVVSVARAHD
jgi:membrane-associated phospholipid phosphatase